MNKIINEIMEIHSKDVCLFKVGTFYHAYGRDACVMAYLFDYKMPNGDGSLWGHLEDGI